MSSAEVVHLAREAASAIASGELEDAAKYFARLETIEPEEALWPQRLGEVQQRLGHSQHAIESLSRAAGLYSVKGDLVKAIALSREILALEPERAGKRRVADAIPVFRGQPISLPPEPVAAEPSGEPLEAMELSRIVPGAREVDSDPREVDLIYEIPLELVLDEAPAGTTAAPSAKDTLQKTPFFSALSARSFLNLASGARSLRLSAGELVFRQGDPGDALYVVAEGAVRVVAEGPPRTELGRLEAGEFFGEIALVTDEPRNATVEAAEDAWVLAFDRALVHQVVEEDGWLVTVLLKFLQDRILQKLMHTHPLFRALAEDDREAISRRARFIEIEAGRTLIRQGDLPKGLFILVAGRVAVTRTQDGLVHPLATLRPGDLCGEMSLLTRQTAIATARATTKCFAIELPAGAFYQLVGLHGEVLDFVKALADERRKQIDQMTSGTSAFEEVRLPLV